MGTTGRSLCAAVGSIVCYLRQPTYIICHRSPPHEYGTTHRSRWLPRTTGLALPADRHPQARREFAIRRLNPPRSERSLPHARFRTARQTPLLRSPTIAIQIEQSQDIYSRSRKAAPWGRRRGLVPIETIRAYEFLQGDANVRKRVPHPFRTRKGWGTRTTKSWGRSKRRTEQVVSGNTFNPVRETGRYSP